MREPLRRQAGLALDPATVKGQAEGDLVFDLKLGKIARPEDTKFHAGGALANLQIEKFLADERLESATASFEADRDIAEDRWRRQSPWLRDPCGGHARSWRGRVGDHNFRARRRRARQARPQFRLVADRDAAGQTQGAADPRQRGGRNRPHAGGRRQSRPRRSKPAGKPGKATFVVKPTPEGASLSNIAIDLGVPMLRGSAQMDAAGSVASATITQARIAPGDDFKADVVNSQLDVKISARGASLDGRAFVKSIFEGTSPDKTAAKDFDLDVKIATVTGANKQAITSMELTASRRGGEMRLGSLRGRIGGGAVTATGSGGETRLVNVRRRRAGPFRQSLFASRRRRSRSGSALPRRWERGRGDPHQLRPARRAGVSPAGQRRAAARVGRRQPAMSMRRSCISEDDGFVRAQPGQTRDPGRGHL